MMEEADRDRLIKIETDVSWLRTAIENHLSEHSKVKMLAIGSVIAAVTALLVALI